MTSPHREIRTDLASRCQTCHQLEEVLLVVGPNYEPAPPGWPTDLGLPLFGRGVLDIKVKCSTCATERLLKAPVISGGKVIA